MDEIVRMITGDGAVKAIAVTGKDLVEHARQIHKLSPLATAALGRSLLGCSMIGAGLKEENGSVTLRIKGDGPLGSIISVSDSQGNVRGYLQNGQVELPLKGPGKLDVGAGVGTDGFLTLIKDIGLKEPYVGSVPLVSGEIAEDLTAYFAASEQIPTACGLGVLVDTDQSVLCAGGYMLQLLPGADDAVIDRLEEAVRRLGPITEVLRQGADAADVLNRLLDGMEPELLEQIQAMGVSLAYVTLHVGLGTFRPVKEEEITDHEMHSEYCMISKETAETINETRRKGGRVICVGTTSCRTIESWAAEDGTLKESAGWTSIYIYPGYRFKALDALITNFHLPESTLVMLVSALAGREHILAAYEEAVREKYRFFSFGDAMFIC